MPNIGWYTCVGRHTKTWTCIGIYQPDMGVSIMKSKYNFEIIQLKNLSNIVKHRNIGNTVMWRIFKPE